MVASTYDQSFLDYTAASSRHAAGRVVSILAPALIPCSVLDVGCANGTWLKSWQDHGIADIQGVDGDYVDREALEIPMDRFTSTNLNAPFDLDRKFDLVQSLEVGEHIAPAAADDFVDSIVRHAARFVIFSAAPPGQGGEHHINEQTYDFWRSKFSERGFVAFDFVRPQIKNDMKTSYWYRYNTFLYVRRELTCELPTEIARTKIPHDQLLSDIAPVSFRIRKALVRHLPFALQNQIARLKARLLPTGRF